MSNCFWFGSSCTWSIGESSSRIGESLNLLDHAVDCQQPGSHG